MSDPLLLHHLLLLRLIAVNRADGVLWHLREDFTKVRVEGGGVDGWIDEVLISPPYNCRHLFCIGVDIFSLLTCSQECFAYVGVCVCRGTDLLSHSSL